MNALIPLPVIVPLLAAASCAIAARVRWVQRIIVLAALTCNLVVSITLLVRVRDDGIGSENPAGGFGLVGIRERVRLLGGRASFGNHPNGGFQLEVTVPA